MAPMNLDFSVSFGHYNNNMMLHLIIMITSITQTFVRCTKSATMRNLRSHQSLAGRLCRKVFSDGVNRKQQVLQSMLYRKVTETSVAKFSGRSRSRSNEGCTCWPAVSTLYIYVLSNLQLGLQWTGNQCKSNRRTVAGSCHRTGETIPATEVCRHCYCLISAGLWMKGVCTENQCCLWVLSTYDTEVYYCQE